MEDESTRLVAALNNVQSEKNWRLLAESMLCRLIVFNRRRGGAIEKVRKVFDLDEAERSFLRNMKIVQTIHKCGNVVAVYLPRENELAMNLLLQNRPFANIKRRNEYFFAASRKSLNPIRGGGLKSWSDTGKFSPRK